jgi:hypothetical protein
LTTPTTYSRIAVIANSGNGNSVDAANLTLHFNDGSTVVTTYIAPDWFFNTTNVALKGFERINLTTGATTGAPNDPRFYQTTINLYALLGASNRPLSSLTFAKPAANSTAIYALSGLPTSAVVLPGVTTAPASNVLATSATLGGQVVSIGNEPPLVTIYYGTADGGTNAGGWSSSLSLGYQTGAFGASFGGLLPGATYYFTASAANAAGTSWAASSRTFTMHIPTLPVVTNLPANSVTANIATLNGAVLSTGNDVPLVTLYFGPTDGGVNPTAWVSSIALGPQAGGFARTVFGLSSNTTYFFAAQAVNGAGTVWAVPSQSFTTAAVNPPPSAVLTHHNDNARTGENLNEFILNVNNVNSKQFGLVYTRAVDDQIYAQPLLITNVSVPGRGVHNLVVVATVNDSVYAFDADDPNMTAPYWQASFLGPNIVPPRNSDMTGACGGNYMDFNGQFGIVGTPVIDPATGTLYLVARTKENGTNFVQRLHALDVTTGAERPNSPTIITATYPGTGSGSSGGFITFDPQRQNQRPGLALVNGVVYIGWASHCDWGPYHGWLLGYDASTLQRVVVYIDTPTGVDGGIWMSGQAPSADVSGNLYISIGNGTVGTSGNPRDTLNRGESFLKLTRNGTNFTIASWFTPYNYPALESGDIDLGSAGMLLIPGTTLAFSGGKEGVVYLVNRDNMGGLSGSSTADTNVVQTFEVSTDEIHGGPIWWDGPDGSYGYIWPASVNLQQYKFDKTNGLFLLPAYALSPTAAPNGQPGGILALSANGTNAGSGIVWAYHQLVGDANQSVQPGILHAYSAQNISTELWNSEQVSTRDSVGLYGKFVPPTVANGKVYLATFSNHLNVYGLLPRPQLTISLSGGNAILTWPVVPFVAYTLQANTNLPSTNWFNPNLSVTVSNGVN